MKIHQGKSKCKEQLQQHKAPSNAQRAGFVSTASQLVEDKSKETITIPWPLSLSCSEHKRKGESESFNVLEMKPWLIQPSAADRKSFIEHAKKSLVLTKAKLPATNKSDIVGSILDPSGGRYGHFTTYVIIVDCLLRFCNYIRIYSSASWF